MALRLLALEARNFRNYAHLAATFERGLNIITGGNAQGKTNLLEAIFWVLRAAPLRPAADQDVVLWGETACRVEATVLTGAGEVTVQVGLGPRGKQILLGGSPVRRADLLRFGGVVTFTPDDLWLVKGGPRERRRFLDREVAASVPSYAENLARYRRALAQRNAALREGDRRTVEVWTQELVCYGARVLADRLQFLETIVPAARRVFGGWDAAGLNIRYRSSAAVEGSDPALLADALRAALALRAGEEAALGQTLVGPHRDDVALELDGRPAAVFASQGQQRSIVLALKLAEVHVWQKRTGDAPLLLLDDVLSELDAVRQEQLLATLSEGLQMFVTATSPPVRGAAVYRVPSGKLTREV